MINITNAMNIQITSPEDNATIRLSGHNGSYTLRTSFSPFSQKRLIDAIDGKYRLEHVGVLDDGTGIFDFRVPRDQQDTLIEDMTELFSDNYVECPACISFAGRG